MGKSAFPLLPTRPQLMAVYPALFASIPHSLLPLFLQSLSLNFFFPRFPTYPTSQSFLLLIAVFSGGAPFSAPDPSLPRPRASLYLLSFARARSGRLHIHIRVCDLVFIHDMNIRSLIHSEKFCSLSLPQLIRSFFSPLWSWF